MSESQVDHSLEEGISAEELGRLFAILSIMPRMMNHDLNSPLNSIVMYGQLIGDVTKKIHKHPDNAEIQRLSKRIERYQKVILEEVGRIGLVWDIYLGSFVHLVSRPFVAVPYEIVRGIQKAKNDVEITITRRSSRSLEMLYPGGVLSGVIAELIENVRRHSKKGARVKVGWSMRDSRFVCRIHDSGPQMLPGGFKGFADLDALSRISDLPVDERGGLRLVHGVLVRSGGELLFSRSTLLRGNLVHFSFPVLKCRMRGVAVD